MLGVLVWSWLTRDSAELQPSETPTAKQSQQLVSSIQPISDAGAVRTAAAAPVGAVSAALPAATLTQDLDFKKATIRGPKGGLDI